MGQIDRILDRYMDADFAFETVQKLRADIFGNAVTAVLAQTNTNAQALLGFL